MSNLVDISKILESKKNDDLYNRFYDLKRKAASSLPLKERMEFNELFADYQISVLNELSDNIVETFNKKLSDEIKNKNVITKDK